MIRYLRRSIPGLLVLLLFLLHSAEVIDLPLVQRLEDFSYDVRLRFTMPGGIDPRIVIVDIDENSLRREGHWPWDRGKLARLLTNLFDEYHAAVAGFDIVFAERDQNAALATLQAAIENRQDTSAQSLLQALQPLLDRDLDFSAQLRNRPVVLGYYFTRDAATAYRSGRLPLPVLAAGDFPPDMADAVVAKGYVANLADLQRYAASAGFFDNPRVDSDGVFRRVPLLQQLDGAMYEALSLAVARAYLHVPLQPMLAEASRPGGTVLEALKLGSLRIPVDREAAVLVPYRGLHKEGFRYISASDVLRKEVANAGSIDGKIVLIGSTAPGLLDLRATPVQNIYPGVEIHANLISGILDQRIMLRPDYTREADFMVLLLVGLALAFTLPKLAALTATGAALGVLFLLIGGNYFLWHAHNMVFPLASSVLMVIAMFMANMAHGFFIEGRSKHQLGKRFGQYVPPELVEEMSKNPAHYTLEGEKRQMTVLFSDVRGFTRLSEGLDPQTLTELMNAFLTPLTRVIHEHRGTIDKYMGDAIMAFWGAPVTDPQHALHAVEAALAMNAALAGLRDSFSARGWPALHMGIGVCTGPMSVGNMGSEFRMAYTVLGDTVNLGSRLESQTKTYGVPIIVSQTTRDAAPAFAYRELDRVRVKGKQQPVTIYEPLDLHPQVTDLVRSDLALHADALSAYRRQDWQLAKKLFTELALAGTHTELCQLFLWRISYLRKHPPGPAWDGVFATRRREG